MSSAFVNRKSNAQNNIEQIGNSIFSAFNNNLNHHYLFDNVKLFATFVPFRVRSEHFI